MIACTRWIALIAGLLAGSPALAQTSGSVAGAVITELRGKVTVQFGQENPRPYKLGEPIQPGMILETEPGADVVLAFPDGQVSVLSGQSTLRLNSYVYDPKDPSKNDVSLNLISGTMRVVMGEIGQSNPAAVRLQVGTSTVVLQPGTQSGRSDASLVVQNGGQMAVSLQEGRAEVRLPTGLAQQVSDGQALYMGLDGAARVGPSAQILQQAGPVGGEIQKQLAEMQGFSQKILQTVRTLASVTSALKDSANTGEAVKASSDTAVEEIFRQLASLPSTAGTAAQTSVLFKPPEFYANGTPSTGGTGGGTPCGASCN